MADDSTANLPPIVSQDEWLHARREFLVKEKEFTRRRDELNAQRRALPMVEVSKDYTFEGPDGNVALLDLFEGRRQLIVQHAMFDPEWEEGCPSCRHAVRDLGHLPHLHEMDTTLALVSRAPYQKIDEYKERMGWTVPYYSSFGSDFNYDFHATLDEAKAPLLINFRTKAEHEAAIGPWEEQCPEHPGNSVFLHADGRIFHTYSTFARGTDILLFTLNYLDLTPLGRQV